MVNPWQVRLLGGLSARSGDRVIRRFRSRHAALLFAYLCLHPDRMHSREQLISLIYAEEYGNDNVSKRFRQSLWSIRRQIEPPEAPKGSVITSNWTHVRMNPDAFTCDVKQFRDAIAASSKAADTDTKKRALEKAIDAYGGELMPGYNEEWLIAERMQLSEAYVDALHELSLIYEDEGEFGEALRLAELAVKEEPSLEKAHCDLIRLYSRLGKPAAAIRQYQELERILASELNAKPSHIAKKLASEARHAVDESRHRAHKTDSKQDDPSTSKVPESNVLLPVTVTRFFGREEELQALLSRLETHEFRLMTLLGPGGCGKTRLAIETARKAKDMFGDVIFVSLVDVVDPSQIADAVLSALQIERGPKTTAFKQIVSIFKLSGRPVLLILDNMEHLLQEGDEVRQFILDLIAKVPHITLLATSRQKLAIEAEWAFRIDPLPSPELGEESTGEEIEQLLRCPSTQMFLDRAQMVVPYFQATRSNAKDLVRLCEKLEGMPLAIELAAPLVQVLTPKQMLQQIDNRLDLFVARRKDVSARHATLRAAIDYSYTILPNDLKSFFKSLAVFQGGCTLDSAESICGSEAMEKLIELRERSLVQVENEGGADGQVCRYRLLETLREYALEQQTKDEKWSLQKCHAFYFLEFAEQIEPEFNGPDPASYLDMAEVEHDNIQAALRWLRSLLKQKKDPGFNAREIGLRMTIAVTQFWELRGHLRLGIAELTELLDGADETNVEPVLSAKAWNCLGTLVFRQDRFLESRAMFERALEIAEGIEAKKEIAKALWMLSNTYWMNQESQVGQPYALRSLTVANEIDDPLSIARAICTMGIHEFLQGNMEKGQELSLQGWEIAEKHGLTRIGAILINNIACWVPNDDNKTQLHHFERSLEMERKQKNSMGIAVSGLNAATLLTNLGRHDEAIPLIVESLERLMGLDHKTYLVNCIHNAAVLAIEMNLYEVAAKIMGFFSTVESEGLAGTNLVTRTEYVTGLIQKDLGKKQFHELWKEGAKLSSKELLAMVRSLGKNVGRQSA